MNLTTLKRVPRHMSFVEDTEMRQCFWDPLFDKTTAEECNFIREMETCHLYVFYFDYLKLIFCNLNLDDKWQSKYYLSGMALIIAILLLMLNLMIVKYFFLPNYLSFHNYVPISNFVYGYIFFSFFFYSPNYVDELLSCPYNHDYQATLEFVKSMGASYVLLCSGVIQLCYAQYRVDGNIFWCNMLVIIVGHIYLMAIVRRKMKLYKLSNIPDMYTFRLENRAKIILFLVIVYCCTMVLASCCFERRKRRLAVAYDIKLNASIDDTELYGNSRISSDDNITAPTDAETEMTGFQLWRNAVSSFAHMKDASKVCQCIVSPIFFIVACLVPVIDDTRPLQGWCKFIVCTSILMYSFIFIPFTITGLTFLFVFVVSIALSLVICRTTCVRRRPSHMWLYTLLGLVLSTTLLQYTVAEFNAISWQILMFCYNWPPDMIAVLIFNIAEIITQFRIVTLLLKRGYRDAAYGVIVGMVTTTIYMILPTLVLHECYNPKSYIAITSFAETTNTFAIVTMTCVTIGVSICGYEFRPLFAIYLLILVVLYYIYQVLSMFEFVHPFGTHHTPNVPSVKVADWT